MLHNLFKENPLSRKDHSAKLILLLYFFLGAFSLVIQTIFIRELFIIEMGNEFVFGIIFSLWLLGIFWGAFTGSRICKKAEKVLPAFFLGIFLIFFISFISIFMVRLMYSLTSTPAGTFISIFKFTIFSFFSYLITAKELIHISPYFIMSYIIFCFIFRNY